MAKTGKSFLAVDLAVALSNGEVWFDRSINTAKVLYWAGEDFKGLIARRAACTRHKGACGVFSIGDDPLSLAPSQAADTLDALANVLRSHHYQNTRGSYRQRNLKIFAEHQR